MFFCGNRVPKETSIAFRMGEAEAIVCPIPPSGISSAYLPNASEVGLPQAMSVSSQVQKINDICNS